MCILKIDYFLHELITAYFIYFHQLIWLTVVPLDEDDDDGDGDEEADSAPQCDGDELQADPPSTEQQQQLQKTKTDRKCVPGIVYLGYIPPRLRPRHVRNLLASYGEIGRIFLQPEGNFSDIIRGESGPERSGTMYR